MPLRLPMMHGYIPPERFLPYLSWTEIDELEDKANTVIVLPVGAIEQHGPHLPCAVDSVISAGVLGKALEKLPALVRAFGLAPITYGKSDEHLHFPGTMTLTGPTLLAVVTEIGESVYRAGFRKLLLANGHGGQPQVLEMAARELRLRHGDFVVVPFHVSRLPNASGRFISERLIVKQKTIRVLLDTGSSGDLLFVRKGSHKYIPTLKRAVPQSWGTSNLSSNEKDLDKEYKIT